MMNEARKMADELGAPRYSNSVQCHWARFYYFEYSRDRTAIGQEVEELIRLKDPDAWAWKALELVRAGKMPEAIAMANNAHTTGIKSTWSWGLAAIILAEQNKKDARRLAQDVVAKRTGGTFELYSLSFLRLFGGKSVAEEAGRVLRQQKPSWPWHGGWTYQCLDFECGDITAEQLLERAGTSQWDQHIANFYVAMMYLADGDRARAKEHFQASINTGYIYSWLYAPEDLILARMDQDPTWPPWITPKDQATTRPSTRAGR
jgi:hypothetical protein